MDTEIWSKIVATGKFILEEFSGRIGDPRDYAVRLFLMAFWWFCIYRVAAMRATRTMKAISLALMIGALIGFIKTIFELVLEWGFFNHLYKDESLYRIYQPVEHFFALLSMMILAYYALTYCDSLPKWVERMKYKIIAAHCVMATYVCYSWLHFFYHNTKISCNNAELAHFCGLWYDQAMHSVAIGLYSYTLLKVAYVSVRPTKNLERPVTPYLILYVAMVLVEQVFRLNYSPNSVNTLDFSIMNNLQLWSIPMLLTHVVTTYIMLLNQYWVADHDRWREQFKDD